MKSPVDAGLSLHLEYDAQQLPRAQAERISRGHLLALHALAQDVTAAARQAPVITGPAASASC